MVEKKLGKTESIKKKPRLLKLIDPVRLVFSLIISFAFLYLNSCKAPVPKPKMVFVAHKDLKINYDSLVYNISKDMDINYEKGNWDTCSIDKRLLLKTPEEIEALIGPPNFKEEQYYGERTFWELYFAFSVIKLSDNEYTKVLVYKWNQMQFRQKKIAIFIKPSDKWICIVPVNYSYGIQADY